MRRGSIQASEGSPQPGFSSSAHSLDDEQERDQLAQSRRRWNINKEGFASPGPVSVSQEKERCYNESSHQSGNQMSGYRPANDPVGIRSRVPSRDRRWRDRALHRRRTGRHVGQAPGCRADHLLTRGPAPVKAYIQEPMPDILNGTIEPGKVFDTRTSLKVLINP